YKLLKSDGTTACGCWIYCGVYAEDENKAARKKPHWEQSYTALEWAWAWPANRRLLYNRASADLDGNPWSERKRLVWWDAEQGKWTGEDVPDFKADMPPDYAPPEGAKAENALRGVEPVIMTRGRRTPAGVPSLASCGPTPGDGCLRPPGWWTGRCPRTTSRTSRRSPIP